MGNGPIYRGMRRLSSESGSVTMKSKRKHNNTKESEIKLCDFLGGNVKSASEK